MPKEKKCPAHDQTWDKNNPEQEKHVSTQKALHDDAVTRGEFIIRMWEAYSYFRDKYGDLAYRCDDRMYMYGGMDAIHLAFIEERLRYLEFKGTTKEAIVKELLEEAEKINDLAPLEKRLKECHAKETSLFRSCSRKDWIQWGLAANEKDIEYLKCYFNGGTLRAKVEIGDNYSSKKVDKTITFNGSLQRRLQKNILCSKDIAQAGIYAYKVKRELELFDIVYQFIVKNWSDKNIENCDIGGSLKWSEGFFNRGKEGPYLRPFHYKLVLTADAK